MMKDLIHDTIRNTVLDACIRAIGKYGMTGATLANIAKEAGISKGGMFYYFKTKQEILQGIIKRYESGVLAKRDKIYSEMPKGRNYLLKATILALAYHPERVNESPPSMMGLFEDPGLRERMVQIHIKTFEDVAKGSPYPERIALIMMAFDGWWLSQQLGGEIYSEECIKKSFDQLCHLIETTDLG